MLCPVNENILTGGFFFGFFIERIKLFVVIIHQFFNGLASTES
jgi:hypothetical protein